MNLYLIKQDQRDGYDTYDSAVVCAKNEEDAKVIHPGGLADYEESTDSKREHWPRLYGTWATSPDNVTARLIGTASDEMERGVVLASFNAG